MRRRDSQAWAFCVLALLVTFVALLILSPAYGGTGRVHPSSTQPAGPTPAAIPAAAQTTIGVWYQPASSFPMWKARGVNTLIGYEGQFNNGVASVSVDQWCASATASGLCYYLQRTPETEKHIRDANCRGWLLGDEPNGGGNRTTVQNQADADACRAVAKALVLVNLDGWKLQWESDDEVAAYCRAGDVIAVDYYFINRGEGPAAIPKIGAILDRLHRLAPGKPILVFIECSDQNLRVQEWAGNPDQSGMPPAPRMRAPTADEMRLEVSTSITHGAAGIAWFPDIIGHNFESYDGTTPDLAAAMTAINVGLVSTVVVTPPIVVTPPAADPLAGSTVTIMGHRYTLTPAN